MSAFRSIGLASGLATVLGLTLFAGTSQGDDKLTGKATPAPPFVRLVYTVRGGSAKELADALKPHFRQPSFLVLPVRGNNLLLLSGLKEDVRDATRLLQEIDRPAQTIRVEVFLVDMTDKGVGSADLGGPIGKVFDKIHELQRQGMIASVQRIELSVLEGDTAKCLVGGYTPYVTGIARTGGLAGGGPFGGGGQFGGGGKGVGGKSGSGQGGGAPGGGIPGGGAPGGRSSGGGGAVTRTVNYRNLGTKVQVIKPEIAADGLVELQIQVEDSQMRNPSGRLEVFTDDKGTGVSATEFTAFTLESRLRIPRGNIVTAQTTQTNSRANQGQKLVLVGVRVD